MKQRMVLWGTVALIVTMLVGCAPEADAPTMSWVYKAGLYSGKVNVLLLTERATDQVIYAAVEGGIYKSVDQGVTWTPCLNGLSNRLVRALALDPDRPAVLYAGTRGGRIYKSVDAGAGWVDVSQGLAGDDIVAIVVDPENPDIVHVASAKHLYTSETGGGQWELRSVRPTAPITSMALDSTNPAIIYVATQDGSSYYSTDRGTNWSEAVHVGGDLHKLLPIPGEGGQLYAIASGKIYRGTGFGQDWSYNDNYYENTWVCCLAVHPREPQHVLVGGVGGVWRSVDGRASWSRSSEGLGDNPLVNALAYDPVRPTNVYVALGSVIYASTDEGLTWKRAGQISAQFGADVLVLLPHPQDPQLLLASVAGGGVYITRDAGSSWQLLDGLPSTWVTALDMSPLDPQLIYAATLQGIPYQSRDGGASWTASTNGLRDIALTALAVDHEQPNQVYVGTWGDGLYATQNWAQGWTRAGIDSGYILDLVLDTRGGRRTIYALTSNGVYQGSYQSAPNVPSFAWYMGTVAGLVPDAGGDGQLLALPTAPDRGIDAAAERGEVRALSLAGMAEGAHPLFLVQNPVAPDLMYAAVPGQGIMQLDRAVGTWQVLGSGLEARQVHTLIVHPAGLTLYAGTDQGVYALDAK